jgi:phosphatidylserine/phosphatidylglycerophosphate/cardiolipin synthase-like enzyme
MRFRSGLIDGLQIFAVAGTNTVSFGIRAEAAARAGLLGFAVERIDPAKGERYFVHGFKVFRSVVPLPDENTDVSTFEHPIQSLVWDDFTAAPGHSYRYEFHPLAGEPKNLDRSRAVVAIDVTTEPLYGRTALGQTHDVFFNRGVASSQAYVRRFGRLSPDQQPTAALRKKALAWLSRDLDDAMLRFIRSARPGDAIRGAFYEFGYQPVLAELKAAIDSGVDVQLVIDLKVNEHSSNEKQRDGTTKVVFHESSPRLANLRAIQDAGLPASAIVAREARRPNIAHNKFMVLLTGAKRTPRAVWTGSTNLTNGGIHGQANVGHWIRDTTTATSFLEYWTLLDADPGGEYDDSTAKKIAKNAALYAEVDRMSPTPAPTPSPARDRIPAGVTPLFSPRAVLSPLDLYVALLDESQELACVTFAFTVPAPFKTALDDNRANGPLIFMLLEKRDAPSGNSATPFIRLNAKNNVYQASGAELDTELGQWVAETDTRALGLNVHVAFVHTKFLLSDPLGADLIVVTGSANFSVASTKDNDENMVIIRGDRRVADIYFTEFNRLFNHYYFRSVAERSTAEETAKALELVENDSWLADKYQPGTLRTKRVEQFTGMAV